MLAFLASDGRSVESVDVTVIAPMSSVAIEATNLLVRAADSHPHFPAPGDSPAVWYTSDTAARHGPVAAISSLTLARAM